MWKKNVKNLVCIVADEGLTPVLPPADDLVSILSYDKNIFVHQQLAAGSMDHRCEYHNQSTGNRSGGTDLRNVPVVG